MANNPSFNPYSWGRRLGGRWTSHDLINVISRFDVIHFSFMYAFIIITVVLHHWDVHLVTFTMSWYVTIWHHLWLQDEFHLCFSMFPNLQFMIWSLGPSPPPARLPVTTRISTFFCRGSQLLNLHLHSFAMMASWVVDPTDPPPKKKREKTQHPQLGTASPSDKRWQSFSRLCVRT